MRIFNKKDNNTIFEQLMDEKGWDLYIYETIFGFYAVAACGSKAIVSRTYYTKKEAVSNLANKFVKLDSKETL